MRTVTVPLALGDVAGKGPPAALLAAEIQGILATYSDLSRTAAATVTHVNRTLCRRIIDSRFATMLYGVLTCDGQLTYSNAGHNPPFLIGNGGIRRLETGGVVLGIFGDAAFEEETIQLDRGDVLVVFSDGVTEAMAENGAEFGDERLLSCLTVHREASPASLLDSVLGTVSEFTAGAMQSDDITSLVLRYEGS
jgi:sigma-B regulation protein RsbU (phosphoserine phosphatase)